MYVVCKEHLTVAIDDFVDVYEQPPDLHELERISFTEWDTPSTCDYCDIKPVYLVVWQKKIDSGELK